MEPRRSVRSCLVLLVLVFLSVAGALADEQPPRAPAQVIAPGALSGQSAGVTERILVKLRPQAALDAMRGGRGLGQALQKARVREVCPLFPDLWPARKGGPIRTAARAAEAFARYADRGTRASGSMRLPDLENILVLTLAPGTDAGAAIAALQRNPEVIYAEADRPVEAFLVPDDPYFGSSGSWGQAYLDLWGLHLTNAPAAWDITIGSESVVVAVVDTGIDLSHPDLAGRLWSNPGEVAGNGVDDDGNGYIDDVQGWDFAYGDSDPQDGYGHGTHVAGTIAASTNNGLGVSGLTWQTKVMAVKGLDDGGSGYDSALAQAMRYAADNGADLINASWGRMGYSQVLQDVVDYCAALGCVTVAAAGNSFSMDAAYFSPAGLRNVVCVAATDVNDVKASFSNVGEIVDASAPGVDILSLRARGTDIYGDGSQVIGGDYYLASGTSMAAPHVVGGLALLLAAHPTWSNAQIVGQLVGTGDSIDAWNPEYTGRLGLGRMDLDTALSGSVTGRRMLVFSQMLDDSLGNGDGQAEGGERVQLSVALKHFAGTSPAVEAHASSWDPFVTAANAAAWFGDLEGWQTPDNAAAPFVLDVAADAPWLHRSWLLLEVPYGDSAVVEPIAFRIHPYVPGWPQPIGGWWEAHPVLADVDSDGAPEVVTTSDGIHVMNADGTEVPGWPQPYFSLVVPCVGDIDGDNSPEVVFAGNDGIYALRADGSIQPGFPVWTDWSIYTESCTLADLDAKRGLEIILLRRDLNTQEGRVEAYDGRGRPLRGWRPPKGLHVPYSGYGRTAVGDINGDRRPEVVMSEAGRYWTGNEEPNRVWAWDRRGKALRGFPVDMPADLYGWLPWGPALGDVDGDRVAEIVASSGTWVHVFRGDGSLLPGWPQPGGVPSLGDIDGDGRPEIVASGPFAVSAYRGDGQLLWSWGTLNTIYWDSSVADVNGDGDVEVLARSNANWIYAWHSDGEGLPDFPLEVGRAVGVGVFGTESCVAVGDINADGYTDLVTGPGMADLDLYAFSAPGRYRANKVEWAMGGGNPRNDGYYRTPPSLSVLRR